jgi:hypothetical protein
VGLRAGLDWCGKSRLTGIRSPDRPARRQSLYRLRYPAHDIYIYMYIRVCVCVCVCVYIYIERERERETERERAREKERKIKQRPLSVY